MYEDLVKSLRSCWRINDPSFNCVQMKDGACEPVGRCVPYLHDMAADAIEELERENEKLHADLGKAIRELAKRRWIPIESRPMDEEERAYYNEWYGYKLEDSEAIIYCGPLPEDGEEVLVCNKYGHIWMDTFDNDPDYGVGFETNGDMDGLVAWMPKPAPYKVEEVE